MGKDFWSNVWKLAYDAPLAYLDYQAGMIGMNNLVKENEYRSDFGKNYLAPGSNIVGSVGSAIGQAGLNAYAPGAGTALYGATGTINQMIAPNQGGVPPLGMANMPQSPSGGGANLPTGFMPQLPGMPLAQAANAPQPVMVGGGETMSDTDYWRSRGDIPLARHGGIAKSSMINIEKGELEVNPKTLEVVRKFEAPKHPKDGSKNPKGNRYVQKGNAIIPADKAEAFKKGDAKTKQRIINGLPKELNNGKAEVGYEGSPWNPDYTPITPYAQPSTNLPIEQNTVMGDIYGSGMQGSTNFNTLGINPNYQTPYLQGAQGTPPLAQTAAGAQTGAMGGFQSGSYINPVGLGMGIYQWTQARKALKDLEKQPLPTLTDYAVSPDLLNASARAESMTKRGFTPQEEAGFKTNLAQSAAARYQKGVQMGGGELGSSIQAAITSQDIGAINRFAAEDAALKRRNIAYADSLKQVLQQQQNLVTQGQREMDRLLYNRRMQTEQNLALAQSQGMQNVAGSAYINPSDIGQLIKLASS